jgi:hypothetical protein
MRASFTDDEIAVINERRWGWERASCADLARIFETTPQMIAKISPRSAKMLPAG